MNNFKTILRKISQLQKEYGVHIYELFSGDVTLHGFLAALN